MFIKEKQNESISTKLIFSKKVICEKIRSGNPLWLLALSRTPKKQKIIREKNNKIRDRKLFLRGTLQSIQKGKLHLWSHFTILSL